MSSTETINSIEKFSSEELFQLKEVRKDFMRQIGNTDKIEISKETLKERPTQAYGIRE